MKEIVISGIDGSGKTTIVSFLEKYYKELGKKVVVSNYKAENTEKMMRIEKMNVKVPSNLIFITYCLDLINNSYLSSASEYDIRIWDRHIICLDAYFSALGIDISLLDSVKKIIPKPDITFLLYADPSITLNRIKASGRGLKKLENYDYLTEVQKQYFRISSKYNAQLVNADCAIDIVMKEIVKKL